ncbi:hypothetical protein APA_3642 [Pseudanabaena sp. lw0831]|nr:hypothetical protein APA_3642 [Pseudanabaena sp. lw0831]
MKPAFKSIAFSSLIFLAIGHYLLQHLLYFIGIILDHLL